MPTALAMKPDLASAFVGTNDAIQPRFDAEQVGADLRELWGALRTSGATVVSLTLPDLSEVIPFARHLSARVAELNRVTREAARATGVILVDLAEHPMATDPRIWHTDRLHANAIGHERIASALAAALGIPGVRETWNEPLPPRPAHSLAERARMEALWVRDYLGPWIARRLTGRSSGDGIVPKRPRLAPVEVAGDSSRD